MKVSFSGIFWGFISLVVGFLFLAGTWGAYAEYNRIQKYSGQAIGKITKKHFKTAADGGGNYYLDYWFTASSGNQINATSDISKQQWDVLQIDDALEVRYDLSDPHRSIPKHGSTPLLLFGLFMLVLGGVFISFGASRIWVGFKKQ